MKKLKPCPFCGERNIIAYSTQRNKNGLWTIKCFKCGANVEFKCPAESDLEEEAVKAWNRMVDQENMVEEV